MDGWMNEWRNEWNDTDRRNRSSLLWWKPVLRLGAAPKLKKISILASFYYYRKCLICVCFIHVFVITLIQMNGFLLRFDNVLLNLIIVQQDAAVFSLLYRVHQKYLAIWRHNCEWNRWCGEFVLERPSSETRSISVAVECWSVEHWAFAVETYF